MRRPPHLPPRDGNARLKKGPEFELVFSSRPVVPGGYAALIKISRSGTAAWTRQIIQAAGGK
jgi:hypothetical protein